MSYRSVRSGAATISGGNTKLGGIPNLSLLPKVSCCQDVPCLQACYAQQSVRRHPAVRSAWGRNWQELQNNREQFFLGIRDYLAEERPKFFRWHVGGDIPDQDYFLRMVQLAREFTKTKFLVFTKHHELDFRGRPDNLVVVMSMWPGWKNTRKRLPRAWLRDPKNPDPRIPDDAIDCPGTCENCGACWGLAAKGMSVVFDKH